MADEPIDLDALERDANGAASRRDQTKRSYRLDPGEIIMSTDALLALVRAVRAAMAEQDYRLGKHEIPNAEWVKKVYIPHADKLNDDLRDALAPFRKEAT